MITPSELRFSMRRLLRAPGYALTVVLLLGLALAANGGVFSVLYGLLYKPLPFAGADGLVTVGARFLGIDGGLSVPMIEPIARDSRSVTDLTAFEEAHLSLEDETGARQATLQAARVEPALFGLLGTTPTLGRLFVADDAREGAAPVVVLGWDIWQQRYAGAEDAIGRTVRLDGQDRRIVGVLPRGYAFPERATRLWLPLGFTAAQRAPEHSGNFGATYAIARLTADATPDTATAEVTTLARAMPGLAEAFGQGDQFAMEVKPLRSMWVGDSAPALRLMLLAVALVLLVTAANLCNLAIARALARRQELAVQAALGAGAGRQAGQAFVEALLPCAAAAALGIGLQPVVLGLLRRFDLVPDGTPQTIGLDAATLALTVALALLVAAAMTLASLWLRRGDLHASIRSSSTRQTGSRAAQRARQTLIVGQIALTAALLVGVGLLVRSSQRLLAQDVGFDRTNLIYAGLGRPAPAGSDPALTRARLDTLIARTRGLPGVVAVGAGSQVPFGENMNLANFAPPGYDGPEDRQPAAYQSYVDEGYFAALGVTPRQGRAFTEEEVRNRLPVAIVDERFVARYLSGSDPIGARLKIGQPPRDGVEQPMRELTIVGVVPTAKQRALDENTDYPAIHQPRPAAAGSAMVVRTSVPPQTLVAPLRALYDEIAPDGARGQIIAMDGRIADSLVERTRLNTLLKLLGVGALVLACVGLYAVLAYAVRMRQGEFGVRMALGADTGRIVRGVLGQGLALVGAGLLVGGPLAYAATHLIAGQLFGVGPFDPVTLAGVAALLAVTGVAACYLPARRAAGTDPLVALRQE